MINNGGYLEIILGPMFSGKSSELIKRYRLYKCINKDILFINHSSNKRYNNEDLKSIITHDNDKVNDCISVNKLNEINLNYENIFNNSSVILIEELQFFEDSFDIIKDWVDKKSKIVICAGLDGDFKRENFGNMYKLYPLCDKITKINALCKKCGNGTPALFTNRIINNNNQMMIGGNEIYESVCRKHYLEIN